MKLRIFMHTMPWEIDSALSMSERLRRCSYYLQAGDEVRLDFIMNLSDAIIDWDKSELDKQFFIDKFNSLEKLNNWSDYNSRIYEGDEVWGHLDAFRDVVNDDYECDAYVSLSPNTSFHNSLLYYVFRSIEGINHDYYWINPQVVKLWDESWDVLVNDHYMSVPYDKHESIDYHTIEKVVNDNLNDVQLIENTNYLTYHSPYYKWAGWFDVHSSKLFDLIMYPDHWKGYGPMDSFFIKLLSYIKDSPMDDKINFKQYIIRNQIVQSGDQFDINRSVYEDRLVLKNQRGKQRKKIYETWEDDMLDWMNKFTESHGYSTKSTTKKTGEIR
jgi:hypothetical protein